ncbi:Nif3-like dinuclear metal center hexameric protein [Sangeribacter muris]|jgi:dinuclear metal center YbgI/SA1388 family protein|uniref:Nif3-like dinuclear metal center hexameric protein n=1 Tax=Sangeribacter muris TaxID=2880703 RepID=UPI00244E501A|nr:Nif3-like dinuclear metal center hexameric protein [Sangeribacter muris]
MSTPLDIVEAIKAKKMVKVSDIARTIEEFAPKSLQESYDNTGLQVGNPDMQVTAALLCLDITEEILDEAIQRQCNLVITHHPLIFRGLKEITGRTAIERIVAKAIRHDVAIYSAHTNLDSAWDGVSHEMAHMLNMTDLQVLEPKNSEGTTGLGIIGNLRPTPKLEFLRKVKETFGVKALKYSVQSPQLVVKRVALCGGSGASLILDAANAGADAIITGDVKYHDFTAYGLDIIIADIGHYESELCACKIFSRIIREKYPDCLLYFSDSETNPVGVI